MKTNLACVSLVLTGSIAAQAVEQKELDTKIPFLSLVTNTFRAGTLTAAPTEATAPPTPNPMGLADTSQVAYVLWRTSQTASGAAINSAPHQLMFARTTDGGKTWSSKPIYTSPAVATSTSYTAPNSIPDLHIGAEGNTVFVSFVSTLPGNQTPTNIYILGSEDQGQSWSQVTLANKTTAPQGGADIWAGELKMAVTRDVSSKKVRAHLAYEFGDTVVRHPTSQGTEAPHHTAFEFVNGSLVDVVTERDISNVPAGQNKDIDQLTLFAKGNVVMLMYRSDRNTYRGSGTSLNQLFGTVSIDGGATFVNEFLLGDLRPPLGPPGGTLDPLVNGVTSASANAASDFAMAADNGALYFLWMDRSHGQGPPTNVVLNERLYLYHSSALGLPGTWGLTEVSTYAAGRCDIDTIDMAAEDGRVVIAVNSDERGRHSAISSMQGTLTNTPADRSVAQDNQGSGNHTNQIQVFFSSDNGKTFTDSWISKNSIDDGTVAATQALTGTVANSVATLKGTNFINCKSVQLEMRGDVCHLCYEQEFYGGTNFQGEDLVMWISLDGGKTWVHRANATAGAGETLGYTTNASGNSGGVAHSDIDSPHMSITSAGTAIVGVRLEQRHAVSDDRPMVFSRPAPLSSSVSEISLTTGGTQNQPLDVGSANANRLYMAVGSVTGTSPGFNLGSVHIPLNLDPWTFLTLEFANSPALPRSRGQLDARGQAMPGLVVPSGLNDPQLIGLKLSTAALIYDAQNNYFLGTNATTITLLR